MPAKKSSSSTPAKSKAETLHKPEGAVAKKKPSVPVAAVMCDGTRRGSFERLLRFTNFLLFGSDNGSVYVRMQESFKQEAQKLIQGIVKKIILEAAQRRYENKRTSLMGMNMYGAFSAYASVVQPEWFEEYAKHNHIISLYTDRMRADDKKVHESALKARKAAFVTAYEKIIDENVEKQPPGKFDRSLVDCKGLKGWKRSVLYSCVEQKHREKIIEDSKKASMIAAAKALKGSIFES